MVRILVAEDDREMRALLRTVLLEYDVDIAPSYDEAVDLIRHSRDGWDVAVLDGAIPLQGDGELLAEFLRKEFPGIKIVSCSSARQSWGDKHIQKSAELGTELPVAIMEVLNRP